MTHTLQSAANGIGKGTEKMEGIKEALELLRERYAQTVEQIQQAEQQIVSLTGSIQGLRDTIARHEGEKDALEQSISVLEMTMPKDEATEEESVEPDGREAQGHSLESTSKEQQKKKKKVKVKYKPREEWKAEPPKEEAEEDSPPTKKSKKNTRPSTPWRQRNPDEMVALARAVQDFVKQKAPSEESAIASKVVSRALHKEFRKHKHESLDSFNSSIFSVLNSLHSTHSGIIRLEIIPKRGRRRVLFYWK